METNPTAVSDDHANSESAGAGSAAVVQTDEATPSDSGDDRKWTLEDVRQFGPPLAISIAMLVLVVVRAVWGDGSDSACGYRMGASNGNALFAGEWQRPFLAPFLHVSAQHWMGNMFWLVLLWGTMYSAMRHRSLWVVFMAGSLTGFLLECYLKPNVVGVGCSGGAYALAGLMFMAGLLTLFIDQDTDHVVYLFVALFFLLCNLPFLFAPGESLLGHIGGFTLGAVCGVVYTFARFQKIEFPRLMLIVGGLLAATVGVAAESLWNDTQPWELSSPDYLKKLTCDADGFVVKIPIVGSQWKSVETTQLENGYRKFRFGHAQSDPVMVSMLISTPAGDTPLEAYRWSSTVRTVLNGTERRVELWGDTPAIFLDQVLEADDTYKRPRWITKTQGRFIDIELSLTPEANERWRAFADAVIREMEVAGRE